jgi:TP901 family phage tail tape measure protein
VNTVAKDDFLNIDINDISDLEGFDTLDLNDMIGVAKGSFANLSRNDQHILAAKLVELSKDVSTLDREARRISKGVAESLDKLVSSLGLTKYEKPIQKAIANSIESLQSAIENSLKNVKVSKINTRNIEKALNINDIQKQVSASINKVIEAQMKSVGKAFRVDKANTVFRDLLKTIQDPTIRSATARRLNAAPKEFWTMWASTSGRYHNPLENTRSGNVKHTSRVASAMYSLLTGGKVPPGARMGSNFHFTDKEYARLANLPQKAKDALMAAALLHDVEKGTGGTGGRLGILQPQYNVSHDRDVFRNMSKSDRAEIYKALGKDLYKKFYKSITIGGAIYDEGGKVNEIKKRMVAADPMLWALSRSDGIATGTANALLPLSPFQVRVAGGLSTNKRIKDLMTYGPTKPGDEAIIRDLLAIQEEKAALKSLRTTGSGTLAQVLTAYRGGIFNPETSRYLSGKNALEQLMSLVDENDKLVMGKTGYVDPDLLKMHYLNPNIMNRIMNSVTESDLKDTQKKELLDKMSTLKKNLDMIVSNMINEAGGSLQDPRKVLEYMEKNRIYDKTSGRFIGEDEALKIARDNALKRTPSDMEMKSLNMLKTKLDLEQKTENLKFIDENRSLINEVKRLQLESRKLSLSEQMDPQFRALKAERERLSLESMRNRIALQSDPRYIEEYIKKMENTNKITAARIASGYYNKPPGGGGTGGGGTSKRGGSSWMGGDPDKVNLKWQLLRIGQGIFGPMLGISSAVGLLRESYQAIRENELALINLRRVFDGTDQDFRMLGETMVKTAIKYGDTIANVGKIQEEWAKTGKKTYEEINKLTEVTELALNTADIKNVDTAVKYLNSSLQQMGLHWTESEALLDSWNKTADQFPADTRDFAEAYQRSASYAKNLGMDMHDLNAVVSMLIESTGRSGEEIGTALRMIFSNLYRPKTLNILKEYGIQLYQMGENGEALTDKFRPFDELLNDMSAKFQQLQQSGSTALSMRLAEGLGEARRRNFAVALLENWDRFQEIRNVSLDSFGYSAKKNEMTMQSLAKQADQFKAAMQSLAVTLGETGAVDLIRGFLVHGTDVIEFFNNLNPVLRDSIAIFMMMSPALVLLNRSFKTISGDTVGPLLSLADKLMQMTKQGSLFENVFYDLAGNEKLASMFKSQEEFHEAIAESLEALNIKRAASATATTAETVAVDANTASKTLNDAINKKLAASNTVLKATTLALVAGVTLLAYGLIRAKQHQQELLEQDITTVRQMKTDLATVMSLAREYDKLKAAGEDVTEVERKMAEAIPEATTGFDDQNRAVAQNIELFKELVKAKEEDMKLDAQSLENKYQIKGQQLEQELETLRSIRQSIINEIHNLRSMSPEEIVSFNLYGERGMNHKTYLRQLQNQADDMKKTIDKKMQELQTYVEGHQLYLHLFDPTGIREDTQKVLDDLDLLRQDYENIVTDVTEIQEQQYDDLQGAMDKIAKVVKDTTVKVARSNGKLTDSTKAAIDFLKLTIPELADIENMTVQQIADAINFYINKDRESTRSQYEEANKRLEIKAEEAKKSIELIQAEIRAKRALLRLSAKEMNLGYEGLTEQEQTRVKSEITQLNAALAESQKALSETERARIEAARALAGLGNAVDINYSSSDSEKYKELDKRLKGYELRVREVTDAIELLDTQFKNNSDNIGYLTMKNELLAKSYGTITQYIKDLIKERDRLNPKNDAEKIAEINQEVANATKNLIDSRNQLADIGKARYDRNMADYERQIKALNTLYEINAAGLKEGEDSFENASLKVALYNSTSSLLEKRLRATSDEIDRVNNKINENRSTLQDYGPEMQHAITAETQALKEYLEELRSKMNDEQKALSDLKVEFISFVQGMLTEGYKRAQEQELERIDELIKAETKRHNTVIENIDEELKQLERTWEEEDYEKETEKRNKKIADLQKELNRYLLDDSQWAAKKRKELQEQINELLEEQAEAEQDRERDLIRQGLEDRKEAEQRAHEEFLERQEEEKQAVQNKYDTLIKQTRGYAAGLVEEYRKNQFDILSFLKSQIPEYQKIADEYAQPFLEAARAVKEFFGLVDTGGTSSGPEKASIGIQSLPKYDKGGKIPYDGPIYAHKGEVVFPKEYAHVLDILVNSLRMPKASVPTVASGTHINETTIDKVLNIEHAEFNEKVDYDVLEARAGIVLKERLYKQGIKIK